MEAVPITSATPETLSQREAARILCVCDRTIRNYIRQGYLSATPGGRVKTRSIIRFLEEEGNYNYE